MDHKELLDLAKKARERAYAPYSSFNVGAALLTKSGKVYLGCNIENASFSPTNCAERTAFFSAIADGEREFKAIAVCGGKKGEKTIPCYPCGVCRQVMSEFCTSDFEIIVEEQDSSFKVYTLDNILPLAFNL